MSLNLPSSEPCFLRLRAPCRANLLALIPLGIDDGCPQFAGASTGRSQQTQRFQVAMPVVAASHARHRVDQCDQSTRVPIAIAQETDWRQTRSHAAGVPSSKPTECPVFDVHIYRRLHIDPLRARQTRPLQAPQRVLKPSAMGQSQSGSPRHTGTPKGSDGSVISHARDQIPPSGFHRHAKHSRHASVRDWPVSMVRTVATTAEDYPSAHPRLLGRPRKIHFYANDATS